MTNIITIDGPSASGKNSVAQEFAKKINYQYLDSGSLYRCFAIAFLESGLDINADSEIETMLSNISIGLDGDRVLINGEDVTERLHSLEVTAVVSKVAAKKFVRGLAHQKEHEIAKSGNTVIVGRAIGASVFPDAPLKFYLTADPETRAQRRFLQLKKKNPEITYDEVLRQLLDRDHADSTREVEPSVIPSDAIVIDTTNLTQEESIAEFMKHADFLT